MLGWAPPFPRLFRCPVFLPAPAWELLLIGNQCDNTRSKLQIFKLTSLSSFSRVPTHGRARRPGSERGVGRMGPSRTQMWFSLGHTKLMLSSQACTLTCAILLPLTNRLPLHPCKLPWIKTVSQKLITLFIHLCSNHDFICWKKTTSTCFFNVINIHNNVDIKKIVWEASMPI